MRALVTGVSGFVGGHLCEHLVAAGDQVVGLSATGRWPADLSHLGRAVRIERLDLVEAAEADLAELVRRKQPEAIYHLAAQSNPQASVTDPRGTWALNLGGTLNLLEAVKASGLKPRVILVGSGTCYGDPAPEFIPVREDCPLRPNNPYAASKAAVDLLGIQHHLAHGTDAVIVRPFNHAGPRQSPRYVLAALAAQVAEVEAGRRECVEVGNLDVVRDFIDVRDVVRGYRLLVERGDVRRGLQPRQRPGHEDRRCPRAPALDGLPTGRRAGRPGAGAARGPAAAGRRRGQAPRRHRLGAGLFDRADAGGYARELPQIESRGDASGALRRSSAPDAARDWSAARASAWSGAVAVLANTRTLVSTNTSQRPSSP